MLQSTLFHLKLVHKLTRGCVIVELYSLILRKCTVNVKKQFQKVFLDALQIVIEPLGWHVEEQSSLEDFFG